ncbi:hypothetical protein [Bombiscardovia coagulans]|uniref:Uncharacterized protein n=1 Tax=Bombiscardovia coagulans TaxID=686666 RepID=A0A261ESP3_9BIFI|nr:hypothetical protein [Bombiscardovia coagulans]OZG49874.1 hypothetical protein BOCO_0391 [Bombiscardovia coagulans]
MSIQSDICRITYEEHTDWAYWNVKCDAVGCNTTVAVSKYPLPDNAYDHDLIDVDKACSAEEAKDYAIREAGWQLGTRGIQWGHVYCPKHRSPTENE